MSKGRLISGKKLERKLRDYYDVSRKWWKHIDGGSERDSSGKEMDFLALEIEQLMRKELGIGRVISKEEIKKHCDTKKK